MSRRSFDDRVRDLVRDDEAAADPARRPGGSTFDAPLMDMVARALVAPMPRRRAVGLIAGALIAGSAWRPGRARAGVECGGSTPQRCESGGRVVCAGADWVCCNTEKCAQACRPWKVCVGEACSDTEKLCGYPTGDYPNRAATPKFFSETVGVVNVCTDNKVVNVQSGWCCPAGATKGARFGRCDCAGEVCGDLCCKKTDEYCESNFPFEKRCERRCSDGSKRCNGICCTGLETCGFFGCSCKSGLVSCGTGLCCKPKEDPGDPNPSYNPIRNMLNTMGQSAAAHGGGGGRQVFARPAQSGSAAVDTALDALAAVNGQGAAAMLAIRGSKRDPAFRQKVTVARAKPPTLSAGPGLDASSVAALNKLLVAEARANALIAAMAKALWRARAAHTKRNRTLAKRQLRASAAFAGQAATALKRVQPLRDAAAKALTAGGVAEAFAAEDAVEAFVASAKSSGIPLYLRAPLDKLGVGSTDLRRLRAGVLEQAVTSATGPALIAPLKSRARAKELKQLISELSKFSTRARRHPIAR